MIDYTLIIHAIIMGLVEGVTEFLPISSTGHLILTAEILDFWTKEKRELFEVAVQIGAIAAVIFEYWDKLWSTVIGVMRRNTTSIRLALNLVIATTPIMLIGLVYGSAIKALLFNVTTVASALIVGGFIILWVEKRHRHTGFDNRISSANVATPGDSVDTISLKQACILGLLQCLALIPGTSRSGATIIGGLALGMSRKAAAEFSFFLGIPVLMGAGLLDLVSARHSISVHDAAILGIGIVVAFISALVVIRALIHYVSKHDFTVFAWYRIIFGVVILVTSYFQLIHW